MNAPATTPLLTELDQERRRAEIAETALAELQGIPVSAVRKWLDKRYAKRQAEQAATDALARFATGRGTLVDLEAITARAEALGFAFVSIVVVRYSKPTDGCVRLDGRHGPPSARDRQLAWVDKTHVKAWWETAALREHLREQERSPAW